MENHIDRDDRRQESPDAAHWSGVTGDHPGLPASERDASDIDDPLGPVRNVARRWRLLIAFVALGMVFGWLSGAVAAEADAAPTEIDHYEARHILVLDSNVPEMQATLGVGNLNALSKRLTVGEVPNRVAESVGIDPTDASQQIRVVIRTDSESLDLVGIGTSPGQAEAIADAYASELFAYLTEEAAQYALDANDGATSRLVEAEANLTAVRAELDRQRAAGNERAVLLLEQDEQQYASARTIASAELLRVRADGVPTVPIESLQAAAGRSSVISQARFEELVGIAAAGQNVKALFGDQVEDETSSSPLSVVSNSLPGGVLGRVALGALFGLLAGVVVAAVMNRLDNRVRSKRQVEELLDLPVIAEVPSLGPIHRRAAEMHAREHPRGRFAEQYRAIASTLTYARRTRRTTGQVVLVASPSPSEGKTTTVANLGAMLAEAGERVLLVNCDFRRPRLHVLTGSEYQPIDLIKTDIPDVELISNVVEQDSEALPTEVIATQRAVIKEAMKVYDLILIDTAPLLATNDAVELLDLVDDVVLVVRAGRTTIQAADRAVEILDRRRAHVLGIAITDVNARNSEDYYYYGNGYYEEGRVGDSRFFPWRRTNSDIDLSDEVVILDEDEDELSSTGSKR